MKAIAISFAALLGVLPLAAQNLAPPAQPSAQSSTQTPSAASASSLSPEQIQVLQEHLTDWAQLGRYRAENAALPPVEPDQQIARNAHQWHCRARRRHPRRLVVPHRRPGRGPRRR